MSTNRRTGSPSLESTEALSSRSRLRVAVGTDASPNRYHQVRAILLKYLSPILVDSVLDRAMQTRRLTPAWLSASVLAEVTADILVGLRLFVPPERLPDLMVELAGVLEEP